MRSRLWQCVGGCVASFLSLQVARAQAPCEADIQRLCKDVPIGSGRVQACLKEHEAEVSESCRQKIDGLANEVKLLTLVCRWDIGVFCSNVSPGEGRVLACLEKNAARLSPGCGHELREMTKQP